MPVRLLAASAACALLVAPPAALAASDGPLAVGTPGPLRALFLDMPLADARPAGAVRGDLRWWMANGWSQPTTLVKGDRTVSVQADVQTDVLQLAVTIPWSRLAAGALARRASTTLEARALAHWGGWSDGPIEAWHGLANYFNFEREKYPRDEVNLDIAEPGGARLAGLRGARLSLGDVALRTQVALAWGGAAPEGGPAWAVALRADVKLPTGSLARFSGSGRPDAGLGLAATARPLRWLTAHALLSARVIAPLPERFPLQPNRVQGGVDVSLVARLSPRLALVLEDRVVTPLARDGWTLPGDVKEPEATAYYGLFRAHNQISGGVRWREVTFFFSEDFTPAPRIAQDTGPRWFYDSNAPDFVLGLAWARALP